MTLDELKAEAKRQGFKLVKIPKADIKRKLAFPNDGVAWTTTEIKRAKEVINGGISIYSMSDELGRTPQAIADRFVDMGLVTFEWRTGIYAAMIGGMMIGGMMIGKKRDMEEYVKEKL